MKDILLDKSYAELCALVAEAGEKPFRARQLLEGLLHGKKLSELPVSPALRARLAATDAEGGAALLQQIQKENL